MEPQPARKLRIEGIGSFVLEGDDVQGHTAVLNALAAAAPPDVLAVLLDAAYGPDRAIDMLETAAAQLDDRVPERQVREDTARIPWPAGVKLYFDVGDAPDTHQTVSFEFEHDRTFGAVLALVANARTYAPALTGSG